MNTLKSAFWEYPQFAEEEHLRNVLDEHRTQEDDQMFLWLMRRLLEYGRAVDALRFFSISEIASHLDNLRLTDYSAKKWRRLVDVYGAS
jgi:hypothetical protein